MEADNQPLKNQWFWSSLKEMSALDIEAGLVKADQLAPWFVDQQAVAQSFKWPRPGSTRINIPNRHLGYVITWYGLALALLGVYGFFLYARKSSIEDET